MVIEHTPWLSITRTWTCEVAEGAKSAAKVSSLLMAPGLDAIATVTGAARSEHDKGRGTLCHGLCVIELLCRRQDTVCGDCSRWNSTPPFQGVPSAGRSTLSNPNLPATFQASISNMAKVKKTGLTL